MSCFISDFGLLDDQDEPPEIAVDLSQAGWYLSEFDRALEHSSGAIHPKVHATVEKVVDLWEAGEKVLVFAFYRYSCRALRAHISRKIEQRLTLTDVMRRFLRVPTTLVRSTT